MAGLVSRMLRRDEEQRLVCCDPNSWTQDETNEWNKRKQTKRTWKTNKRNKRNKRNKQSKRNKRNNQNNRKRVKWMQQLSFWNFEFVVRGHTKFGSLAALQAVHKSPHCARFASALSSTVMSVWINSWKMLDRIPRKLWENDARAEKLVRQCSATPPSLLTPTSAKELFWARKGGNCLCAEVSLEWNYCCYWCCQIGALGLLPRSHSMPTKQRRYYCPYCYCNHYYSCWCWYRWYWLRCWSLKAMLAVLLLRPVRVLYLFLHYLSVEIDYWPSCLHWGALKALTPGWMYEAKGRPECWYEIVRLAVVAFVVAIGSRMLFVVHDWGA